MSVGTVILAASLGSVSLLLCCALSCVPERAVPNGTVTIAVPSAAFTTVAGVCPNPSNLVQVPFCFWSITGCLPFSTS